MCGRCCAAEGTVHGAHGAVMHTCTQFGCVFEVRLLAIALHHSLRVQRRVRDNRASYLQSLDVLRAAKATGVYTKSSIMLGLGETDDEIIDTLVDLRDCGVDIVTFGQYLQPTSHHLEVVDFVPPEKFEYWRRYGEEELGFRCATVSAAGAAAAALVLVRTLGWAIRQ
jgi:lipoate synthase